MSPAKKRRTIMPPHIGAEGLSTRDEALARVESLMAEGLTHRPRSTGRPPEEETKPVEPIDPNEAREEGAEPPPPHHLAAEPAPPRATALAAPPAGQALARGFGALNWLAQTLILLFVLMWVFILGIFIGRGYLLDTEAGRQMIQWVEQTMGWRAEPPAVVVTPGPSGSETTPATGTGPESLPPEPAPSAPPDSTGASEAPTANQTPLEIEIEAPNGTVTALPAAPPPTDMDQEDNEAEDDLFLTPETLAERNRQEAALKAAGAAGGKGEMSLPPTEGAYAVQATFALNEAAAVAAVNKLSDQGFPAYFYKNSKNQYLVRVGRFETFAQAEEARARLVAKGYRDPYISKLE